MKCDLFLVPSSESRTEFAPGSNACKDFMYAPSY